MTNLPPTHNPQSHTTPNPTRPPPPRRAGRFSSITPRTAAAPIAAFTMAILLYTYSVTSINAAKRNAALHRAADGGQLDMRRESLRRHGALDRVEGTRGVELFRHARDREPSGASGAGAGGDGAQEAAARKEAGAGPTQRPTARRKRTEVEGGLEGWKGREGVERFKGAPPPPPPPASSQPPEGRILDEGKGR